MSESISFSYHSTGGSVRFSVSPVSMKRVRLLRDLIESSSSTDESVPIYGKIPTGVANLLLEQLDEPPETLVERMIQLYPSPMLWQVLEVLHYLDYPEAEKLMHSRICEEMVKGSGGDVLVASTAFSLTPDEVKFVLAPDVKFCELEFDTRVSQLLRGEVETVDLIGLVPNLRLRNTETKCSNAACVTDMTGAA